MSARSEAAAIAGCLKEDTYARVIYLYILQSCCHEQAYKKKVSRNSTCLSESLHVVLSCHFQHGAAAAHADVMFNELNASTVQGLDIKVLS